MALAGMIITLVYGVIALLDLIFPQYLGTSNANNALSFTVINGSNALKPPSYFSISGSWWYLLGTTNYGIPILPVMFAALKFDLGYSLLVVSVSLLVGTLIGTLSGFYGRIWDSALMRITDAFMSVPVIVAVALFAAASNSSVLLMLSGFIFVYWASFARTSRSYALLVRNSAFIEAAIASGATRRHNLVSHVIPNIISPIIAQIPIAISNVIVVLATFDFFFYFLTPGLSLTPELGNIMAGYPGAANAFHVYPVPASVWLVGGVWWPIVIPGIFLIILVVGLNMFSDGLIQYFDPRRRSLAGL